MLIDCTYSGELIETKDKVLSGLNKDNKRTEQTVLYESHNKDSAYKVITSNNITFIMKELKYFNSINTIKYSFNESIYFNLYHKLKFIKIPNKFYLKQWFHIMKLNHVNLKYFKLRNLIESKYTKLKSINGTIPEIDIKMLNTNYIERISERYFNKLDIFSKNFISELYPLFNSFRLNEFKIINKPDGLYRKHNEFKPLDHGVLRTVMLGFNFLSDKKIELRSNSDLLLSDARSIEPKFLNFKQKYFSESSDHSIYNSNATANINNISVFKNTDKINNIFNSISLYKFIDIQMKLKLVANNNLNKLIKTNTKTKKQKYNKWNNKSYLKVISSYSNIEHDTGFITRIYSQFTNYSLPYWNAHIFIQMLRLIFMSNRFLLLKLLSRALFTFRFHPNKSKDAPKALKIEASGLIKKLGRSNKIQYKLKDTNKNNIKYAVDYENLTALSRYGITNIKVSLEN